MQQLYPHLRLGYREDSMNPEDLEYGFTQLQEPDEDYPFFIQHIFAHDDDHIYDVYGKSPIDAAQDYEDGEGREYRYSLGLSPEDIRMEWPIQDHIVEAAKQRIQQHSDPNELPNNLA